MKPNTKKFIAGAGLAASSAFMALIAISAEAATATNTFTATVDIQADCIVASTNTLDFGTPGVLTANIDTTAIFNVQCTNSTTYNVGLNAGTGGGTIATRKMDSGTATVDYQMYRDAGYTLNWGETVATDTVSGTGNGATQPLTVYGRIPSQTTAAPGTYNDTVTVTITF